MSLSLPLSLFYRLEHFILSFLVFSPLWHKCLIQLCLYSQYNIMLLPTFAVFFEISPGCRACSPSPAINLTLRLGTTGKKSISQQCCDHSCAGQEDDTGSLCMCVTTRFSFAFFRKNVTFLKCTVVTKLLL